MLQKKSSTSALELLNLPDRLMLEGEVAKVLGCSVQTLRNNRQQRKGLPYVKIGRNVRYTPADIAADILANRIDPDAA